MQAPQRDGYSGGIEGAIVQTVLAMLIIGAVVALSMATLFYGARAFGWIMQRYPKTAAALAVSLVLAVLLAAASFSRFFPNCRVGLGMMKVRCYPSAPLDRAAKAWNP